MGFRPGASKLELGVLASLGVSNVRSVSFVEESNLLGLGPVATERTKQVGGVRGSFQLFLGGRFSL